MSEEMNLEEKLYAVLCDSSEWRIPEYPYLVMATGVKSKNSIFKALRRLQQKERLDFMFKPLNKEDVF